VGEAWVVVPTWDKKRLKTNTANIEASGPCDFALYGVKAAIGWPGVRKVVRIAAQQEVNPAAHAAGRCIRVAQAALNPPSGIAEQLNKGLGFTFKCGQWFEWFHGNGFGTPIKYLYFMAAKFPHPVSCAC